MTRNTLARAACKFAAALALALPWQPPAIAAGGDALAVSAKALTMRAGPNRGSEVRAWLKRGDPLTEIERQGPWIKVDTGLPPPKKLGWVHSRYVAPAGAASTPVTSAAPKTTPKATPKPAPEPAPAPQATPAPEPETAPVSAASEPATPKPEPAAPESDPAAPAKPDTSAAAAPEPAQSDAEKRAAARKRFEAFYREYQKVTARYRSITGKDLFSSAVDKGSGRLELTATEYWFTGTDKDRENDVATVMKLWKNSQESGNVLIVVIDDRRKEQMRMFEKVN